MSTPRRLAARTFSCTVAAESTSSSLTGSRRASRFGNPVQTSARYMEPERLKREFGRDLTF